MFMKIFNYTDYAAVTAIAAFATTAFAAGTPIRIEADDAVLADDHNVVVTEDAKASGGKFVQMKDGNLALIYLILYSAARIIVEMVRIDSVRYLFGVPVAIVVSAGIIILSGILLYKRNK